MSKWGKRIKEARLEFGISAVDAAAELGVSRRTLEYYESGKTCPNYDLRVMIDEYYGIPCDRCEGVE